MNLSAAADLADLLAALGIIATVIFLALQIRQNTKALENTRWESYLDRLANSFARPMDERVATVILKGNRSFNALSDAEKLVYSAWADEYILSAALLSDVPRSSRPRFNRNKHRRSSACVVLRRSRQSRMVAS